MNRGVKFFLILVVIVLALPVLYFIFGWTALVVGLGLADQKFDRIATERSRVEGLLGQELGQLPVYPGATVGKKSMDFSFPFVVSSTIYTAVSSIVYKASPDISANTAMAFYDHKLRDVGWQSTQQAGHYVRNSLNLLVASNCAAGTAQNTQWDPEHNCVEVKGGYQEISLILYCDIREKDECHK